MKIKATRQVMEEAELTTPCWFKKGTRHYFIAEKSLIEISEGMICRWDNGVYCNHVFQEKALEASKGEPITQEEFNEEFDRTLSAIIGPFVDIKSLKISS